MSLDTTTPESRWAMLAGALGGLAGLVAGRGGHPEPAEAAAGSPLIIGFSSNNSLYQQGPGTALMGYTTLASGKTRGVYGRVDSPDGDGVQADTI